MMNLLPYIKTDFFKLFCLYFIANIFLLLNYEGIYWDDWTLYNNSFEAIHLQFSEAVGSSGILISSLHYYLTNDIGVFSYRILTFLLLFMSGVLVFKILASLQILSKRDIFFIVLFFLVAPVFSARIALINFPYTLFSTIFFLAFYLLSINLKKNNWLLRIITLSLFFLSFLVNSLLVFYAVPLLYLFYRTYLSSSNLKENILNFLKTKIDFLILPIVFFIVKSIYFVPTALYVGYNNFGIGNLFKASFYLIGSYYGSFIEPIDVSFSLFGTFESIVFFLILYAVYNKWTPNQNIEIKSNQEIKYWLLIGLVIFFFAVYPYCVVGKVPNLYNWDSRHQLLVPLGFAFILYFSILYISQIFQYSETFKKALLSMFIFIFISANLHEGFKFNMDWFYSVSIQQNIKNIDEIKNNTTFITYIIGEEYLADKRTISFYEYNGMFKKTFGDDTRFVVNNIDEIDLYRKYSSYPQYNFLTWTSSKPIYFSITANKIGKMDKVKLFYFYIFNYKKFLELSKKITTINVLKIDGRM